MRSIARGSGSRMRRSFEFFDGDDPLKHPFSVSERLLSQRVIMGSPDELLLHVSLCLVVTKQTPQCAIQEKLKLLLAPSLSTALRVLTLSDGSTCSATKGNSIPTTQLEFLKVTMARICHGVYRSQF